MEEILHQLIPVGSLSHYLQGFFIPGGAGFLLSTVSLFHTWIFQRCQMVPLQGVNSPSFTVYLAPKLEGAGLFTRCLGGCHGGFNIIFTYLY